MHLNENVKPAFCNSSQTAVTTLTLTVAVLSGNLDYPLMLSVIMNK